jgi:A/G-specific adenine glycosylase
MMDLGATICTPRNPACGLCPWSGSCAAYANGSASDYPKKQAKKAKPVRYGVAFVYLDRNGVLVRRRPNEGLLGGMLEVPNLLWRDTPYEKSEIVTGADDLETKWVEGEPVRHVFTHFELRMRVFAIHTANIQSLDGYHHLALGALAMAALPSLMQKIIASGQRALSSTG